MTPDNGEKFITELSNGTLTNIEGLQAKDAELMSRSINLLVRYGLGFETISVTGTTDMKSELKLFEQAGPADMSGG